MVAGAGASLIARTPSRWQRSWPASRRHSALCNAFAAQCREPAAVGHLETFPLLSRVLHSGRRGQWPHQIASELALLGGLEEPTQQFMIAMQQHARRGGGKVASHRDRRLLVSSNAKTAVPLQTRALCLFQSLLSNMISVTDRDHRLLIGSSVGSQLHEKTRLLPHESH